MSPKTVHELTRRAFLVSAGAGVVAAPAAMGRVPRRRPPNVLFLFSDEHRWQSMSFTELPEVHTPNMARLAEEGAQCRNCISNYPVCSPYRAMLLTGLWPYQTGLVDNDLPLSPDHPTTGDAFRDAGYRTGYIGKWHLGGVRAEPFGFDHSLIWEKTNLHWDESVYYPADGSPVTPKGYNATRMTDQTLEFIRDHRDVPFFLAVSWNPPHANFTDAPEAKKALYPQGSLPYRPNYRQSPAADESVTRLLRNNGWPYYEGYHAHISAIDDELGRVLGELESLGLDGDTIVIYTSDHGSMFGSHGVGGKRQPYEESIRVPFIVRWPGKVDPARTVEALFGTIDLAPTLCGLAGISVPPAFRGMDFSGHFTGHGGPTPSSQFIMHIAKNNASGQRNHPAPLFRGVRTSRRTFFVTDQGEEFLYDNRSDPYQLDNLAQSRAARRSRERCLRMTRRWLATAQDPFELPT